MSTNRLSARQPGNMTLCRTILSALLIAVIFRCPAGADGSLPLESGACHGVVVRPAWDYHPRWSPDGGALAFSTKVTGETGLAVVDAATGEIRILPTGLEGDHHLDWSPDGREIVFDARRDGGPLSVWRIGSEGGEAEMVAEWGGRPMWSPDGGRIAFIRGDRICVVDLESGRETRVTPSLGIEFVTWSPDGKRIAFDADGEIGIVPATGGEARILTRHAARDFQPAWSPDGAHILFVSLRSGSKDLWLMPVTGGDPIRLTDHPGNEWHPHWRHDGGAVAFTADWEGGLGIWRGDLPASE